MGTSKWWKRYYHREQKGVVPWPGTHLFLLSFYCFPRVCMGGLDFPRFYSELNLSLDLNQLFIIIGGTNKKIMIHSELLWVFISTAVTLYSYQM